MPETKANSEGEALCKLVNRIVTTKEIIVKETRRFITEAVSIDDLDDTVYQRTEFIENGVPSKSVSEDCQTESVEVVPISSLDATRVGQQIKSLYLQIALSLSFTDSLAFHSDGIYAYVSIQAL